ncbi:imelysin family protein [Aquibium sp. ELW1220]|uniref:imelysin family protein n=1 Tax=Aquibium sp. ELW1220 TaxID=2976766 RepID=UPI0025B26033|nr:imelysin family protein [Aquibium sp. ELW1220]MDN2579599.1 peptidase M75, Imelysin [Aquibium sp. ELW1220]
MILKRLLFAACFAQAAATPAIAAEPPGAAAMVQGAIESYVRPAYASFASNAGALRETVDTLCAGPSAAQLAAARAAFAATAGAWSRIELVRFGPVTEENRLERVLYWPDRRSTGLKQVQAILAESDATAAAAASLAGKSVAVQGLGAMEFVLFGTGSDDLADAAGFRCAYASAISGNVAAIAGALDAAWVGGAGAAGLWAAPGPGNPLYRDGGEALGELLDTMIHGLELVRDVRINGFLGEDAADDKPKQALFWRSGETIAALRGNLASIAGLMEASDMAAHLPEDRRWIVGSARFELANASRALETLDGRSVADILADPDLRAKLDYVRLVTSSLSDVIGRQLSAEFGLTVGFSSLDGD